MRNARLVFTVFFQLTLTFGALFCIYMLFAILDNDEVDMISEIGMLTIHPVFAIIFSVITMAICILIGLPIRFNSRLNKYWVDRSIISLAITVVGLILLFTFFKLRFYANITGYNKCGRSDKKNSKYFSVTGRLVFDSIWTLTLLSADNNKNYKRQNF